LGKRFLIGARVRPPDTLAESVTNAMAWGARRVRNLLAARAGPAGPCAEEFWALRDVTFDVEAGQVVGIVGRNGSGKSTLLKILSRISAPTEGDATLTGRVGSLLEIGTGFHSELTGRENAFLSGAMLGMRQHEISARFDEIVDFSGVERFIDTAVKHYSSGMYLRLAFAVAAHLRAEILLIDEVLAVGDAAFQKKCIDKMNEVARGGRTVLFVSHNLGALARLCDAGILLDGGVVRASGPIGDVLSGYARLQRARNAEDDGLRQGGIAVSSFELANEHPVVDPAATLNFSFVLSIRERYWGVHVYLGVSTPEGQHLLIEVADGERHGEFLQPGRYRVDVGFPPVWLRPRAYSAWVKIIAHPQAGRTERFFSDWLEIVVAGDENVDTNTDRLLAPGAIWRVTSLGQWPGEPATRDAIATVVG
jgi:lipopolysaccharide transport system ATP-binding protein